MGSSQATASYEIKVTKPGDRTDHRAEGAREEEKDIGLSDGAEPIRERRSRRHGAKRSGHKKDKMG